MKYPKRALLLVMLCITCLHCNAVKTILCGHFHYLPGGYVTVQYYATPIDEIESIKTQVTAMVDGNKDFRLEFDISEPKKINVMQGESWLFYNKYINPGDSIRFDFDTNKTLIAGNGENGLVAMFQYDQKFLTLEKIAEFNATFKTMAGAEFAKYWSDRADSGLLFYQNYFSIHPAPKQYVAAVENEIKYETAVHIIQFERKPRNKNKDVFLNPEYMRYVRKYAMNNEDAIRADKYSFYLGELTKSIMNSIRFDLPDSEKYNNFYEREAQRDSIARTCLKGKMYDIALYAILNEEVANVRRNVGTGNFFDTAYAKTEKSINELGENFNDKQYFTRIKQSLASTRQKDSLAYDFSANTLEGKKVKLSDFRGKVVYVDFWATNCVPCVQELPYIKDLQEKYKSKDVVFLYVSFDDSQEMLEDFIKKKGFTGIHLVDKRGFASDAAVKYNISGIPKHLLIDRKGVLISSDAPRPSMHPEHIIDRTLAGNANSH